MTQLLNSMFSFYGGLPSLIAIGTIVLILFILTFFAQRYSKEIEEWELKEKRNEKRYKSTRQDVLISWIIGVMIFCLIIGIIVYIIAILGNQLNEAMILCANCTTALS